MVPLVNDTGPVSVNVVVPIDKTPFVNVSVPETVWLPVRVTPAALLIVRLLKVIPSVPML